MDRAPRKYCPEAGFTLIEIALSVLLLGAGLTTLIALQTRYINSYQTEQNLSRAAFYGQYIMTLLEVDKKLPEEGSTRGELVDLLREEGYFDDELISDSKTRFSGWEYEQTVSSISLPEQEDVLRRIDLSITWGPSPMEKFNLVYFIETGSSQRKRQ